MAGKTAAFLNKSVKEFIKAPLKVDVVKIAKKAREYFFLPKKATQELKNTKLMSLLNVVCSEVKAVITACTTLSKAYIKRTPWTQAKRITQIRNSAEQYLKDVRQFILTGNMYPLRYYRFI